MNAPGSIAVRAAQDARANIGVQEVGNNAGKWVEIYLASVGLSAGAPWCAAFVYYRIITAAHELGQIPNPHPPQSGYCPDWQDWAKANNLWLPVDTDEKILPGDVCLFYFPVKGRVAHAGIVVERKLNGAGVYTVEGNTSPEVGSGVNREGDGVYQKDRNWHEFGSGGGFIRLPW